MIVPESLKPVLVNASLKSGGSGKAAWRLFRALRREGVDARLLCPQRSNGEPGVEGLFGPADRALVMLAKAAEIGSRGLYRQRKDVPFTSAILGARINRRLQVLGANVVHLQNCHHGFASLRQLRAARMPAVWTVHDWWPITGGCHTTYTCDRHRVRCGACPALQSRWRWDLSRWNYRAKERAWRDVDMILAPVGRALQRALAESPLFAGKRIELIPNGIDLESFRPLAKEAARDILRLPPDATIFLFGAKRTDPLKGFASVEAVMAELRAGREVTKPILLTLGDNRPLAVSAEGWQHHGLGMVEDEVSLALAYAAADITLMPSSQESFGLMAAESMACGTPALVYRVDGVTDIVDHQVNGYVAQLGSKQDYVAGVRWLLAQREAPARRESLRRQARSKIEREFDLRDVARRYVELYRAARSVSPGHAR